MNQMIKVARYEISDVVRSKWAAAYALFFFGATELLVRFGSGGPRAMLSLGNVILFVIPLVGLLFATLHFYNSRRFIEMLLVQPIGRGRIFAGVYSGILLPLCAAFLLGTSLPFLSRGWPGGHDGFVLAVLLVAGCVLTAVFVGLAMVFAVRFEDKARGLGAALLTWLMLTLVYDGLVLLVLQAFADYPLEKPVLAMMLANPVDLARVLLMMQMDTSALMGFTGAVFERFFGSIAGPAVATGSLVLWSTLPLWAAHTIFRRRDF